MDESTHAQPWIELSRRPVPSPPYRDMVEVDYRLPDGSTRTFTLKRERSAAAVLALTTDGRVVLARQFRPGPGIVLDELPGGSVEPGESFEEAARRELLEETGYVADRWIALGRAYECAYSTVHREGFLALGCRHARAAGSYETGADPAEPIEVVVKPVDDFVTQLLAGATTDGEIAWMGLCRAGLVGRVTPS